MSYRVRKSGKGLLASYANLLAFDHRQKTDCVLVVEVADWFAWPWYRRWPWHWGTWSTAAACSLGKFQPVSPVQVEEIEALLKSW